MNKQLIAEQLDSIQLLRAIAAIAVVTQHIPIPIFGDGFWGVDLFFVISGFIMCYVTQKSSDHFFTKRLIRIVPLYWVGTIGIFILALIAPKLLNTSTANISDLIKSLTFIPFQKGTLVVPLLLQGWTLNYEMFFYILFAFSTYISHRYRVGVCSAIILSIVILGRLFPANSLVLRFFSDSILLEFILGMFCFLLFAQTAHYRNRRSSDYSATWILAGVLAIVCLPFATKFIPFDERVVKWGILAALVFFCIVHGMSQMRLPKYVVLVGDASYSLYLFHVYIIQGFNKAFKLNTLDSHSYTAYMMAGLVITVCVWLSVLLYKYIEKPVSAYLRKRLLGNELVSRRLISY